MLARSSYCIASRAGVVFRQMCCCIELIGPSRASISYMAKFLAAYILYSRRDFQVFNYLSSYSYNQDFLSSLLVFYSKDYRAKPSLWIHRQNMVPYQWPQWLVVDAIGAQLRAFGNSTDQPMSCFFDTQPTRSLRATCAQPARNLPAICAFGNHNYIYLFYTNSIF